MPKAAAVEVQAGDRAVRVSSPDRVIYEATERTAEVTKLMVAKYFGASIPGLSGEGTQFTGLLIAYLILAIGCIFRGL